MSKFEELRTEIRDACFLQEALADLGHAVEFHAGGIGISDYDGNPHPHRAFVVVRKTAGFLSDFGFTKTSDGRFALVVDEYDQRFRLGPAWMGRLLQTYKEKETIAMARAKGYALRAREVTETPHGPQVRLQFVVTR
jgi:arylamine N-acetyltransferase